MPVRSTVDQVAFPVPVEALSIFLVLPITVCDAMDDCYPDLPELVPACPELASGSAVKSAPFAPSLAASCTAAPSAQFATPHVYASMFAQSQQQQQQQQPSAFPTVAMPTQLQPPAQRSIFASASQPPSGAR